MAFFELLGVRSCSRAAGRNVGSDQVADAAHVQAGLIVPGNTESLLLPVPVDARYN